MTMRRLTTGLLFLVLAIAGASATASAAELKVLAVSAVKPALAQLAPEYEKASHNTLKIVYASEATIEKKIHAEEDYDAVIMNYKTAKALGKKAKLSGGLIEAISKKLGAASTNWTEKPLAVKDFVDFLTGDKAQAVIKAKKIASAGALQPIGG